MRHNASLTRITCSGIVDADDYSDEDRRRLSELGIAVLPVSEIENLFLLPDIAAAILEEEKYHGAELSAKLDVLKREILAEITRPGSIDEVVLRYCRRRIDRTLKKIDLKDAATPADLAEIYSKRTAALDINDLAKEAHKQIEELVTREDIPGLLAKFDNKALLALAAKHLKSSSKSIFESWLTRAMHSSGAEKLKAALDMVLPVVVAI